MEAESINLTAKQEKAYHLVKEGKTIFLTGPGGCGKTFLIRYIVQTLSSEKNISVTAMTGIAATLIGGLTIHAWGSLGSGKNSKESIVTQILRSQDVVDRWKATDILVIDEISMMSAELFNKLNYIAQRVRENDDFFGGLQLIISGDFCQLPPVDGGRFCFESENWKNNITNVIHLTEIIRQKNLEFQNLLNEIRLGIISIETKKKLNTRLIKNLQKDLPDQTNEEDLSKIKLLNNDDIMDIKPTVLYPYKKNVDELNQTELNKLINELKHEFREYLAEDDFSIKQTKQDFIEAYIKSLNSTTNLNGQNDNTETQQASADPNKSKKPEPKPMQLKASELKTLKEILNTSCPADVSLKLAIGTQVMLLVNIDFNKSLVNGSRGVVIGFDPEHGYPKVKFQDGMVWTVHPHSWTLDHPKYLITRKQIPLALAWSITVHKSQGSTLSLVLTDLKNIFSAGQGYVTLSRIQSLEGLYLSGINYSKIKCDPKVKKFYMQYL